MNVTNKAEIKQKTSLLIWVCLLISIPIIFRDIYGISVNKYVFVLICAGALLILDYGNSVVFYFYLLPMFSGLPGNYMRILFLLAFIYKQKKVGFDASIFVCTALLFLFELLHIRSATGISQYVFWGLNLFMFVSIAMFDENDSRASRCIVAFSISVSITFLIIFITTIKMGYLEQILYGRYRFGDFTDFASEGYVEGVHLSLDPNYLGYFCLSSIIALFALIDQRVLRGWKGVFLISINTAWGLFSLSRTFLLLLVLFGFCIILIQWKNQKRFWCSIAAAAVLGLSLFLVIRQFYPDVIDTLARRLVADDVTDGNGRTELIKEYFKIFLNNPLYMLLGTGCVEMLTNTRMVQNLHCTPLEILVGTGVEGTAIVFILVYAIIRRIKNYNAPRTRFNPDAKLNLFIHFMYLATLPAMGNTAQLGPLMVCVAVAKVCGRMVN